MDRLACVEVPHLSLQLLLERHPDWQGTPVCVVEEDKPLSAVLQANEAARRRGILPGMRYASALSLDRTLRAEPIAPELLEEASDRLLHRLVRFSPQVEPLPEKPGAFWLDATGLERLFGSLKHWARSIRNALTRECLSAHIVVGFERFGTWALARSRRGITILPSPEAERKACRAVRLDRLDLPPDVRDRLERLGIRTVGRFLALPPDGIRRRFGDAAWDLYRLARGWSSVPLQATRPLEPVRQSRDFERPERNTSRLTFVLKCLLHPLLDRLADEGRAVREVELQFDLDDGDTRRATLQPAGPTLDLEMLMELGTLRLERLRLPTGVVQMTVELSPSRATEESRSLFREHPRRDLSAARTALARIRAEFGSDTVVRPEPGKKHLPEGRWRWEPVDTLILPRPREVSRPRLVRRVHRRPRPLGFPPTAASGSTSEAGPYYLSGGWWIRPVRRDYRFTETGDDRILWIFYDVERGRWFLQGWIE